jgi:hypothetical protein
MADSTRYRVVDFIGGRILEAREMMAIQSMTEGLDSSGNVLVHDLNAIYREGATLNVQPVITSGTRTVTLTPIDTTKPMQVFLHGRWETLRSGDAPPITLGTSQFNLYLNWALNIITSVQDPSLVDSSTGAPTANMGELDFSVSATDTSATTLGSTQLAKNTAPIVLFNFVTAGASVAVVPQDNVLAVALGTNTAAGPVKLSTSTASGVAAGTDDPRLSDSRTPAALSVVDASVRVPVPVPGATNPDGSNKYDLSADPGGISADKIIWQTYTERLSDFLAWIRAQVASVVTTLTSHIGVALGSTATHPMPTASQVGAAPLSHVGMSLGQSGSHPATVNADSGGFVVNQDPGTFASSANDPAYAVMEGGAYKAGLEHGGDVYSALLAALIANPGGTPLHFTGALHGLESVAQVLVDHVNQNAGATNPHGLTLGGLGGTALSISTATGTTGAGITAGVMNWLILRFAPNGTNAIEVALGAGVVRHAQFVPLPNTNFSYANFLASCSIGLGMGHGTTYNNINCTMNLAPDGSTPTPGQVYCSAWNNVGAGIPGELDSGNPMRANVTAVVWRTGA